MLGEEIIDIVSETNALKHQLFEAQKLSRSNSQQRCA
jgi:hypothetical protein